MARKSIPQVAAATQEEENPNSDITLTLADREPVHFYFDLWQETTVPSSLRFRLRQMEMDTEAANVLHEILTLNAEHSRDAEQNGVNYTPLSERHVHGITLAQNILLHDLSVCFEGIRKAFASQGGAT